MTVTDAVELLRSFNEWRRQDCEDTEHRLPMPDPRLVGNAIDIVCHVAEEGAPPGYKSVLKFPSTKMIEAGIAAHRNDCEREQTGRSALVCMIWHSMINGMDN